MQGRHDTRQQGGELRLALDQRPRADIVAVEIGAARAGCRYGGGDRRIFMGPVELGAGEELDRAAIEARMHAVAVEFDFVQPIRAPAPRRRAG
jgi:hypothetical protein